MHEEVNQRIVSLSFSATRLTARVLARAFERFLAESRRNTSQKKIPRGRQTFKQLMEQNAGAVNMELENSDVKSFDRIARKYHIDYAVKKDRTSNPPRFLLFFKSRDQDAVRLAFQEYLKVTTLKKEKPPLRKLIEHYKKLSLEREKSRPKARIRGRSRQREHSL